MVTSESGDCNMVWKWANGGASAGLVDIPLIRTAEMYLTRAEANYNLKQYTPALADLNIVRSKRYSDYEAGNESGESLEKAIQLQRRLELAFEGHRFFADSPYYLLPIPQSEIDANENMIQNKY